jgi:hypothetical protein
VPPTSNFHNSRKQTFNLDSAAPRFLYHMPTSSTCAATDTHVPKRGGFRACVRRQVYRAVLVGGSFAILYPMGFFLHLSLSCSSDVGLRQALGSSRTIWKTRYSPGSRFPTITSLPASANCWYPGPTQTRPCIAVQCLMADSQHCYQEPKLFLQEQLAFPPNVSHEPHLLA